MARGAQALISGDALRHNLQRVRQLAPQSKVLAMVKGNAYGHGVVDVARNLHDVDAFGVAFLNEALLLREAGIDKPILLMQGFLSADELPVILEQQLQVVIHALWQVELLEGSQIDQPLSVWLKLDSGMHRSGLVPEDFQLALTRLQQCQQVRVEVLMTHFSCADNTQSDTTVKQIACFETAVKPLQIEQSLANSAAIVAWPDTHADWIRPGIMLYGGSPLADKTAAELDLQPVMTLQAKLIAVKQLAAGDAVGYGENWICPEAMPIGVVALGYGDGYPRHAKNGTPVLINGQRSQIIGTVSMDMITVDLRCAPTAKVGDLVTFWGDGLPVDEIAAAVGTISYELLSHINNRVDRIVL